MTFGLKWRLLDVGFVVALLLLAAVPLVFLRGNSLWGQPAYTASTWAAFAGTFILWAVLRRRNAGTVAPADTVPASGAKRDGRMAWWQLALVAVLLAAFTLVCFYLPLRIHFWGGADDFLQFQDTPLIPWMVIWDGWNRPFTVLACVVGRRLTPDHVDGFLWLGAALCWLNGLLLFVLLREVLPQARLLPVVAAVLLVADRSDPSRFFVLWTSNIYWSGVAFLLAGAWLFLWSYRRGSRLLLVVACALLGGALLTSEGAYPLAVLVPGLAWFLKDYRQRLLTWACAWLGTLTLLATRFLIFLSQMGKNANQSQQSGKAFRDPETLWRNLRLHLEPGFSNFQVTGAMAQHWRWAALVLALVAGLAVLAGWRGAEAGTPRRHYLLALGLAALALLLGIVPFLSMSFVFRTQFYAAPGLAVLLASGFCLAGSLLGRRVGATAVTLGVALLAANATAEALAEQHQKREQTPFTFVRTVHILRQIHAVCPNPTPDTLILLYPDDDATVPFQRNYCCVQMSKRTLGACVVPVNHKEPTGIDMDPEFHADGVTVTFGKNVDFPGKTAYDRVLAVRLAADDTITLMRRLPAEQLPPGHEADRYQPLALIQPGPVKEPPFLRYPRWVKRPHDLFGMGDGVVLGRGWGLLENHEGERARQIRDGAELLVNPLGQSRRQIHLDVAAGQADQVQALNRDGQVVATAHLTGRQQICLTVPTDTSRMNLIRLRFPGGTASGGGFRAFCPGSKQFGPEGAPARPALPRDVNAGDLSLGGHWHLLETFGGQTFRWAANDAEIILEANQELPADLVVDVQGGPSLGGKQSFQLSLLDPTGQALATAQVQNRQSVHLAIPVGTQAGTVLRLHAEGGGLPAGNGDNRVLNFRVFRCAWRAD